MTSLFLVVIAILLGGAVLIATFTYYDPGAIDEGQIGMRVAENMAVTQEASANFFFVRDQYPVSVADLESEAELPDLGPVGGYWKIDGGIGCIGLVDDARSRSILSVAQKRVTGSVITSDCGAFTDSGVVFLAVSLDGVSTP